MKNKDIVLLLFSVFILVFAWVIFNIYHNSAASTISQAINRNIAPISPNFDTKTIDNLKKRGIVSPIYSVLGQTELKVQNNTQQATQEGTLKL